MRIVFYLLFFIMIFSLSAYGKEFYRVKKGDSLYEISKRFHVSIDDLKEVNNLPDDRLKPGIRLRIPSRSGNLDLKKTKDLKELEVNTESSESLGSSGSGESGSSGPEFHIVKKGDTLSSISKKYGISFSELKEINELKSKKLRIGQKILLKRSGPRTYTVKKGDNIWKIAKRFKIDVEELKELNKLDSDDLKPGQRLVLEAWIDEKEIKRYDTSISELKALEDVKIMDDLETKSLDLKDRIVFFAKKMLNIPYRFGGRSFKGIDCSGYVQEVFSYLNIPLPRTAREQFEVGESVSKEELNIGDLVFFRTYASFPSHVGIYLGSNLFIHASSKSRKVTIDSLKTPYYLKRFIGAKRIVTE